MVDSRKYVNKQAFSQTTTSQMTGSCPCIFLQIAGGLFAVYADDLLQKSQKQLPVKTRRPHNIERWYGT